MISLRIALPLLLAAVSVSGQTPQEEYVPEDCVDMPDSHTFDYKKPNNQWRREFKCSDFKNDVIKQEHADIEIFKLDGVSPSVTYKVKDLCPSKSPDLQIKCAQATESGCPGGLVRVNVENDTDGEEFRQKIENCLLRNQCPGNKGPECWDVQDITNMDLAFFSWCNGDTKCQKTYEKFNAPIGHWNTRSVTNMHAMFGSAVNFNQDISSWDVSSVTDMNSMFWGNYKFDQPVGAWDTAAVKDMGCMFCEALMFNQPLNSWDVSSVTDMSFMFYNADSFNQPLDNWDVVWSQVDYTEMLDEADAYSQEYPWTI